MSYANYLYLSWTWFNQAHPEDDEKSQLIWDQFMKAERFS